MRGLRTAITLAALAGGLLSPSVVAAQGATADFTPADYVVKVDGKALDAEVWQSRIAGHLLILSDQLGSPVRLVLREARAETVQFMKVDKRQDGGLTVLPDAAERDLGSFKVSPGGAGVTFSIDGKTVELGQKPALLGDQDLSGMKEYSRDYELRAEQYRPSRAFIDKLRAEGRPVRVEVYFGSWCPYCQEMVPRMMRVAEELEGSKIEVDFYGLPQGEAFSRDPRAKALDITGVPTGVVFIGDEEIGRIKANGWKIPELTLNGMLVGN